MTSGNTTTNQDTHRKKRNTTLYILEADFNRLPLWGGHSFNIVEELQHSGGGRVVGLYCRELDSTQPYQTESS